MSACEATTHAHSQSLQSHTPDYCAFPPQNMTLLTRYGMDDSDDDDEEEQKPGQPKEQKPGQPKEQKHKQVKLISRGQRSKPFQSSPLAAKGTQAKATAATAPANKFAMADDSDEEETPRVQRRGSASDDSPAIAITSTPAGRGAVRSTHQRKDVAASLSSSSSATRQYLIL